MKLGFPRGDFAEFLNIAHGGQGEVYRVNQLSLGRHVVMKIMHFDDSAELEAATNTIKQLAAVTIQGVPGIIRITREKRRLVVVMEWIQGLSLAEFSPGSWSVPMRLLAAGDICAVLENIHQSGWSHGDLKPQNILLDRQGKINIIDLGFAKKRNSPSQQNGIRGTGRYLPPESVLNQKNDPAKADLYSLGIMLYELLSGSELKRDYTSPGIKAQPIPGIPEAISRILIQCLAVSPDNRPASVTAVGSVIGKAAGVLGEEVRSTLAAESESRYRTTMAQRCITTARKQMKGQRNQAFGLLREALTLDRDNAEALSLLEGFPASSTLSDMPWKKLAIFSMLLMAGFGVAWWFFKMRPSPLPSAADMLERGPSEALAGKPKTQNSKSSKPVFQLTEKQAAVNGRLIITGLPPDAQLSIDGKPSAAESPSTILPVPSGSRILTLIKNGKSLWTDTVHVPPHAEIKVNISLKENL